MVGRATRKKGLGSSNRSDAAPSPRRFRQEPSAPASEEDKAHWKGFCEIESEPAYFNVMLKKFGVQGVKVHEVFSLDKEILQSLPRPVYGLIFLFKWMEEEPDKQEQSCPEGVWFANQTINNACASVALLNIVNNVPSIELGENLRAFKEFTASFSPALRGDAIGNFEFVKDIHNSFARKMDMLNGDLLLSNEATASGKGKKRKANDDANDKESGFHFVAFMPIGGQLWKLDGLERQPMCLGAFKDDWLGQAKPDIEARMAQYEEGQIEFAILSLVRDPLLDLIPRLAENIKSITELSARLDLIKPDWREFETSSLNGDFTGLLTAFDPAYGLTSEHVDQAELSMTIAKLCESDAVEDIVTQRQRLSNDQAHLRLWIRDEQQSNQSDEEIVAARRRDYGAMMQNFVRKVKAKRRLLDEPETA